MAHSSSLSLRVSVFLLILLALPVIAQAGPHPDCTCEFCLENIDAKCTPAGGGVASCSSLIRSGACLGLFAETSATVSEDDEAACAEAAANDEAWEPHARSLERVEAGGEDRPDRG